MSEVPRNEFNQIIDTEDFPVELWTSCNSAERRYASEMVESVRRELLVVAIACSPADLRVRVLIDKLRNLKCSEAAMDLEGAEHYNANRAGYQQAAIEEDTRRTADGLARSYDETYEAQKEQ